MIKYDVKNYFDFKVNDYNENSIVLASIYQDNILIGTCNVSEINYISIRDLYKGQLMIVFKNKIVINCTSFELFEC